MDGCFFKPQVLFLTLVMLMTLFVVDIIFRKSQKWSIHSQPQRAAHTHTHMFRLVVEFVTPCFGSGNKNLSTDSAKFISFES